MLESGPQGTWGEGVVGGREVSSSAPSVLIYPEDPHSVQLGKLGDEHGEQGDGIDYKVGPVVFGVEAGQDVPVGQRREMGGRERGKENG